MRYDIYNKGVTADMIRQAIDMYVIGFRAERNREIMKYKLADRVNLGLEWMMHFTLSDKLDCVKDPYHISSTGIFKNTDSYSSLQVSLTYSFWEKCKTCLKD